MATIPHTVDGMTERLQQMTRIVQDEVDDMRPNLDAELADRRAATDGHLAVEMQERRSGSPGTIG